MVELFSRPWGSIQLLVACLISWGVVENVAFAKEEVEIPFSSTDSRVLGIIVEPGEDEDAVIGSADAIDASNLDGASVAELSRSKLPDSFAGNHKYQKPTLEERFWWLNAQGDTENDLDGEIRSVPDAVGDFNQLDEPQADDDEVDGLVNDELGDDELGILRVRSQPVGINDELGTLRIRSIEDAPLEVEPEPTRQTSVFLTARSNVYGGNNLFRTSNPIDDRIYQAGVGVFAFPRLSNSTNLVLSAEANLARYEDLSVVDYNEVQFQGGIRQRLGRSSYGQLNWRYQDLSTPGGDSFFTANYVELLLSRRDILNNRTWLDSYYQARLSNSDPKVFSRFTQIVTGSLNYGFDPDTRVSLLYQLFLDDYTEIPRHDTYHQILAQFSHDLSSTTRISLFTGVRFGRSSLSIIDFDDTIYGATINVNVPLF